MAENDVTPAGDAPVNYADGAAQKRQSRMDMLKEISGSAREERAEMLRAQGEEEIPGQEPEQVIEAEAPSPEPEAQAEPEATPAAEPAAPPDDGTVEITVDGRKERVPRDAVYEQGIRTLQKQTHADRRMEQAAVKLRELDERERALEAREREASNATGATPPNRDVLREKAGDFVTDFLDGSEQGAAEKLVDFAEVIQPQPQQIDEDKIVNRVTEKAERRLDELDEMRNRKRAVEDFVKSRPDIAQNDMLWNAADRFAAQYHHDNPDAGPDEVLAKAAEYVDKHSKGDGGQSPAPSSDDGFKDKEERKARATETPNAVSHRQQPPPAKPRQTGSDIVAEKAKRRGQTVY